MTLAFYKPPRFMRIEHYINKIFRVKGYKLVFKSLKRIDAFGQTMHDEKVIEIDLKTGIQPAKVFVHELLHYSYPSMCEREVTRLEGKIWDRLTVNQIYLLYKRMISSA